jgi:shikimate O-hydroxycinnamoyltransferase
MCWFYRDDLDSQILQSSLSKALVMYPVLSGRYDGTKPPTWVALNNAGVPVEVATAGVDKETVDAVISRLTSSTSSIFGMADQSKYIPSKEGMDPDTMSPDAPLFKVKITLFPSGGTAIGVLCQHGIADAEALIQFMINWSGLYAGQGFQIIPNHDRSTLLQEHNVGSITPSSDSASSHHTKSTHHILTPDERVQKPPEFASKMSQITGGPNCVTCLVPFSSNLCNKWKEEANAGLPEGQYCSTDDLLTARTWQCLVRARCGQVGVTTDSEEIQTTLARAVGFRKRANPAVPDGYFGNAATNVRTSMSVRRLLEMTTSEIALLLRHDLLATPEEMYPVRGKWLQEQNEEGRMASMKFDENAMTFIVSSWNFAWERCRFGGAAPCAYDQGCLVPIVAVIVPRAGGEGMSVYVCGPKDDMKEFAASVVR